MPSSRSTRGAQTPRIDALSVPSVDERRPIEVDFTFDAGRRKVASVDVAFATPLGTVRQLIPAAAVGIEGREGGGRLGLDLTVLPAGMCELTLELVSADGRRGPPTSAAFELPRSDGSRPVLRAVKPRTTKITRPGADDVVVAHLAVAGEAGEDEIAALWVRLRAPDGVETATAAAAAVGKDSSVVTLAAFRSDHELGKYAASVTLVDRLGNFSEALETMVELVEDGGAVGPSDRQLLARIGLRRR